MPAVKLVIKNAILLYPVLFKAQKFKGEGKARYSCTLVIDQIDEVRNAAVEAAQSIWANKAKAKVDSLERMVKTFYKLQDDETKLCAGKWHIRASSTETWPTGEPRLIRVVDASKAPIEETDIWAGCIVNAVVSPWAQNNSIGGERINCNLDAVQLVRVGERLGEADPLAFLDGSNDVPF